MSSQICKAHSTCSGTSLHLLQGHCQIGQLADSSCLYKFSWHMKQSNCGPVAAVGPGAASGTQTKGRSASESAHRGAADGGVLDSDSLGGVGASRPPSHRAAIVGWLPSRVLPGESIRLRRRGGVVEDRLSIRPSAAARFGRRLWLRGLKCRV